MQASPQTKQPRVAIVDDHYMIREGWRLFLQNADNMDFAWAAASAAEAEQKVAEDAPAVLLVDISLPDRLGLDLIKELHVKHPNLRMLAFSMHDEKQFAQRALKAGANGYVMKSASQQDLETALRLVLSGGVAVSNDISQDIVKSFSSATSGDTTDPTLELSNREFEIFSMVGHGKSSKQIAVSLGISPNTVDVHKLNIRTKLKMGGARELTYFAVRWVEGQKFGRI